MKILNILEAKFDLMNYVRKVNGKWALVSKHTGKPLRYFDGEGKPSREWANKAVGNIHAHENDFIPFRNVLNEETRSLSDLYDENELNHPDEDLYRDYDIDQEKYEEQRQVKELTPSQAAKLKMPRSKETLINHFEKSATKDQRKHIEDKARDYNYDRVVVLHGDTILDGGHQVLASIEANKPLRYIDIS